LVLNLSDAVLNQGPAYAFIVLMICMLLKSMFRRHASWQLLAAVWGLKLPLVGALIKMSNTAVWTRCMSTLLESGVPLLDALEVSAGTCRNRVFAISTWAIRHMVSQGGSLSHAMQHAHALIPQTRQTHSVFDELLTQLVSVGEETGHLGTLLTQAANEQEQALERQIDSMTQLIEPVMVVVLGGIVGGLVVALYLPVFQLGQVL
jgi:type IV pilus assembly protein PilC